MQKMPLPIPWGRKMKKISSLSSKVIWHPWIIFISQKVRNKLHLHPLMSLIYCTFFQVLIDLSSTSHLDNTPRWYPLKEQTESLDHGKPHPSQSSQRSPKPSVIKSRSHGIFPDPSKGRRYFKCKKLLPSCSLRIFLSRSACMCNVFGKVGFYWKLFNVVSYKE